jgi:hypothetical protein
MAGFCVCGHFLLQMAEMPVKTTTNVEKLPEI